MTTRHYPQDCSVFTPGDKVELADGSVVRVTSIGDNTFQGFNGVEFKPYTFDKVLQKTDLPITPPKYIDNLTPFSCTDSYMDSHLGDPKSGVLPGFNNTPSILSASTRTAIEQATDEYFRSQPISDEDPDIGVTDKNFSDLHITYNTQSQRHNQGKTQVREVDPQFILGIGEVLTKSRAKYDAFNWALPTKLSTPYESALRHLMAFQSGEDVDPDDGLSHLLKVATNIMFMYYHITNNPEESDDRFFKGKK